MIYNINKNLLLEENAVKQHLQKYAMPYAIGGILGASSLYNYINPEHANSDETSDTRSPAQKLLDKASEVKNQLVDKSSEVLNNPKSPDSSKSLEDQHAAPILNYDQYTGKLITPEHDEYDNTKKMLKVLAGVGTASALAMGVGGVSQVGIENVTRDVKNSLDNKFQDIKNYYFPNKVSIGNVTRDFKNGLGNKFQDIKNYYFPDKEILSQTRKNNIKNAIKYNTKELNKRRKEARDRASEVSEKIKSELANKQSNSNESSIYTSINKPLKTRQKPGLKTRAK